MAFETVCGSEISNLRDTAEMFFEAGMQHQMRGRSLGVGEQVLDESIEALIRCVNRNA
jgi:hypothetical protein